MKYLLVKNEDGQYINKEQNKRYDVLECHNVIGPRAKDFVEFENLQEALKSWHLEPVEPKADEVEDNGNRDN